MNRAAWTAFVIQILGTGCAIAMGGWVELPWIGIAALGLLGACSAAAGMAPGTRRVQIWKWGWTVAWGCTVIVPGALLLGGHKVPCWDGYYAFLAWLITSVILLAGHRIADAPWKSRWRLLGMAWAFIGCLIYLVASYLQNLSGAFHIGLLLSLILLLICKSWFRIPAFGIQTVNTLILLLIGLPLTDLLIRPHYRHQANLDRDKKHYSYEMWKKDPEGFDRWQGWYYQHLYAFFLDYCIADPAHVLPYRLKPSYQGIAWENPIAINRKGFRGREIPEKKGNAYRIVALGESTTFGVTTTRDDRPWPEFLEQIIQERLRAQRPVQVINAGVPGYDLKQNLYRLPIDILPLKPDMIISYHGWNGFRFLNDALPSVIGPLPPPYRPRPLKLLADCEYHVKIMIYKHRLISKSVHHPRVLTDVMDTEYAQAYRQLIQIAHTNNIRLAIANYSMAVNDKSDPDVIGFYRRAGFLFVDLQIPANISHSLLITRLAQQYPDVCFVDTHPHLDGEHEKFIDLIHFNEEGDRLLAETIFAGIKNVLETDLARPGPPNPPNTTP